MRVLDFALPEGMLDRALDLVDKAKITRMMGRHSGAIIHTVKSQALRRKTEEEITDRAYLCLPRFCTCHGFAGRSMHGNHLVRHNTRLPDLHACFPFVATILYLRLAPLVCGVAVQALDRDPDRRSGGSGCGAAGL